MAPLVAGGSEGYRECVRMLDVFQHGLLLATHLGFFAFGWVFFYRKLFKDFEVRARCRPLVKIHVHICRATRCPLTPLPCRFDILQYSCFLLPPSRDRAQCSNS